MPEVAAVLLVLMVAVGIFVAAKVQGLRPLDDARVSAELAQAEQSHVWLTERLEKARAEKWDGEMIGRLEAQLNLTMRQLVMLKKRQSLIAAGDAAVAGEPVAVVTAAVVVKDAEI